jgi:hypothetical protein
VEFVGLLVVWQKS